MEALGLLLKLSHVVLAMTIVAGTLGSWLLNRRASRSEDVELIWQLTRAAAPFDRMQTVSGPLLVLSGLATAWAQGLPLLGLGEGWILASVLLIILLIVLVVTVLAPAGARVERAILASRAEERATDELRVPGGDHRPSDWPSGTASWSARRSLR